MPLSVNRRLLFIVQTFIVPLALDVNVPMVSRCPRARVMGSNRDKRIVTVFIVETFRFQTNSRNLRLDGNTFEIPDQVPIDDGMIINAVRIHKADVAFTFKKILKLLAQNKRRKIRHRDGLADDGIIKMIFLVL